MVQTASPTLLHAADPVGVLSAQLADGIDEAVASPPDAQSRSMAISSLVREIFEAIEWLHGADGDAAELDSLAEVVAAAHRHQIRMSGLHQTEGQLG